MILFIHQIVIKKIMQLLNVEQNEIQKLCNTKQIQTHKKRCRRKLNKNKQYMYTTKLCVQRKILKKK